MLVAAVVSLPLQDGTVVEDVPPLSLIDAINYDNYSSRSGLLVAKGNETVGVARNKGSHDSSGMYINISDCICTVYYKYRQLHVLYMCILHANHSL